MVTLRRREDVRRFVAQHIRLEDVPGPIWKDRGDPTDLDCILDADPAEQPDLLASLVAGIERDLRIVEQMRAWSAPRESDAKLSAPLLFEPINVRRRGEIAGFVLRDYEHDRARVLAEAVAEAAEAASPSITDHRPRVRRFREDVLGGGVLVVEQALAFVRSPAVRALTSREFAALGVSPTAHAARFEEPESGFDDHGWRYHRVVVVVDPPGRRFPLDHHARDLNWRLPIFELPVAEANGKSVSVQYWPRSLIAELQKLSEWLSKYFPWSEAEAAWFVLAGAVPQLSQLDGRFELRRSLSDGWERATVTLTIEPWISADTVARFYREMQRHVLPTGQRGRERALSVRLFAQDQERAQGRHLTLEELHRRWNAMHPDAMYASASGLARALKRGEQHVGTIFRPGYRRLGDADVAS